MDNEQPMIGIYRITCIVTGQSYIGQSKDIKRRWLEHERMLQNNEHHSKKLQMAYNRWGPLNFIKTIVKLVPRYDKKCLDKLESGFVKQFNSYYKGFNMTENGGKIG